MKHISKIPHKWWHRFFTSVSSWRTETILCNPPKECSSIIYVCTICDKEYEFDTTKERVKINNEG